MTALVAGILAIAEAEELRAEIRIDSRGERILVDLGVLRAFTKETDPSSFSVGRDRAKDWIVPVDAAPGQELVIEGRGLRIVLAVAASDKRRGSASCTEVLGAEAALVCVSDTGEGRWRLTDDGFRLPLWAKDGKVTVDGIDLATKNPLVRGARSTVHLLPIADLNSSVTVAQACYDAVLAEQWPVFVSMFEKHDRDEADKYASCRLYWMAVRRTIEKNNVVEFRYKSVNAHGTKGGRRKLMFQRIDDDGRQVGLDTAIVLVLEDGEWKVDLVSP